MFFFELGDDPRLHRTYANNTPSPKIDHVPKPNLESVQPPSPRISSRSSPNPINSSNPFQEQINTKSTSQQETSGNIDDIAVGTLLDITGDDMTVFQQQKQQQTAPAPSIELFNNNEDLFNLNINTQPSFPSAPISKTGDLFDVDFTSMSLNQPIIHRNASETVLPVPLQATSISKPETKASSSQNIDRLEPFKDLFAPSAAKTSSNQSLASIQAAGASKPGISM